MLEHKEDYLHRYHIIGVRYRVNSAYYPMGQTLISEVAIRQFWCVKDKLDTLDGSQVSWNTITDWQWEFW